MHDAGTVLNHIGLAVQTVDKFNADRKRFVDDEICLIFIQIEPDFYENRLVLKFPGASDQCSTGII